MLKKEWTVECYFDENGPSIQEVVQKYYFWYYQNYSMRSTEKQDG